MDRSVTASADRYLGQTLSERYRVLQKLGEGGMGAVYLAEHVLIERKVALKVLSDELARKGDLVTRFIQEAKAASRIGHENVVDITDFGETPNGSVYFAMEHLDGRDLATVIRDGGALPLARARPIMLQIADALAAAHDKGIIHRDVKPANVFLVTRDGRADFVKVLDFGIAKLSTADERGEHVTKTGMVFGTAEYMSPEQARGDAIDQRIDVYACGCVLYEMLTGDVPFRGDTFMGVLHKHVNDPPEPPSRRAPGLPSGVDAVVLRALAKDPADRYATMRDFARALETCDGVAPRRSRLPTLGVVLGGLGTVAAGAWALRPGTPPPPTVVATPAPRPAAPVMPPAPVEPALHSILVETTAGAEVFRGEERLGLVPGPFQLAHSSDAIALTIKKAGYADYTLQVRPDQDRRYRPRLVPLGKAGK